MAPSDPFHPPAERPPAVFAERRKVLRALVIKESVRIVACGLGIFLSVGMVWSMLTHDPSGSTVLKIFGVAAVLLVLSVGGAALSMRAIRAYRGELNALQLLDGD